MEDFARNKHFQFGTNNPTLMDKPYWKYMVCNPHLTGYHGRQQNDYNDLDVPIYCFARFGVTQTYLPDGRLICIGGEHEDSYDPDFQIYNDVVVIRNPHYIPAHDIYTVPIPTNFPGERDSSHEKSYHQTFMLGTSNINDVTIYGYPKNVFPPIDFHTATYVQNKEKNEFIYIIGGLGYSDSPHREETHVYRLSLSDFTIEEIRTSGNKPDGMTNRHRATLVTVQGRQIIKIEGRQFYAHGLEGTDPRHYELNVETAVWTTIDG